MIKEAIAKIVSKEDLTYQEAYDVMNEIMSGQTTATQNAAFLSALSTKELRQRMRSRAARRPCAITPPGSIPAWMYLRS